MTPVDPSSPDTDPCRDTLPEPEQPSGPGLFGDAPATPPARTAAGTQPYRVLARQYRPRHFDDLIGQDALVRTLRNAFALNRVAHAFMLTGVRGVGKTTTARIIARALNCTGADGQGGPTADPCGVCPNCTAILADRHPDVVEMDAASRTGVDDVREIIEATRFRPLQARTKVFIIDEVHMLSRNAFNALLKTLEEPPPHVTFIFATTELRKVPVTVLSRCQRFDLRRIDAEVLSAHFSRILEQEGVSASPQALALIARAADGSVRDGLSLLDQAIAQNDPGIPISEAQVADMLGLADRGMVLDLLEALMAGDTASALAVTDTAHARGADLGMVLQDLLELIHTLTRLKTIPHLRTAPGMAEAERLRGSALADRLAMPVLGRAWQMLLKGIAEVEAAPDRRAAAEMVLIRLCYVADLPPPAELVRRLTGAPGTQQPGHQGGGGVAPSTPSSSPTASSTGFRAIAGGIMSGGSGAATARQPHAMADSVPDVPVPVFHSFREVAQFVESRREAMLHAHLLHNVHLVRFAPPVIELRLESNVPHTLPAQLAALLGEANGQRWTIALSSAPGEPTLAEQGRAAGESRLAQASNHPVVRAILNAFPGARLGTVIDSTVDVYGLTRETHADPGMMTASPMLGGGHGDRFDSLDEIPGDPDDGPGFAPLDAESADDPSGDAFPGLNRPTQSEQS
ncbi:DNA polymerase III subunit gamma/tau [Granulibacter bethesdensis]|uniref:DNA polymerase III subunit gamma/tau n=1 Tax=Granulibacter bethesdensis TaxID=364410 RepID=UPI00090C1094|nr:DNA polymerase III subunit gamma/tau [Granulibacter bethesdensis]APH50935.1 DNA polymerase III subunit gamma/tau [Granulibacter bethesdensis]